MASAEEVVTAMKPDLDACLNGKDRDVAASWAVPIAKSGPPQVMAVVFRRFGDATLAGWLAHTTFIWRDFTFEDWKDVLTRIADDAPAIYQFVPFATRYLGIDIVRVIHDTPALDPMASVFVSERFPKGGPAPGDEWIREMLEENGVDQHDLWRRLAQQGAPMRAEALEKPHRPSPEDGLR